jgi:hypothetical protein
MDVMVQRFLGWPVPFSVCADLCATRQEKGRSGTNLLSAIEAREMLTYVTDAKVTTPATPAPAAVVPRAVCGLHEWYQGSCAHCHITPEEYKAMLAAAPPTDARDAERYRWLRERYSAADMAFKDFGEGQVARPVAIFSVENPWPFSFDYEEAKILLDAAIDAAMKGKK